MLRPFLLALIVVGAGASSVGEVTQPSDVATWRWQVATILDAQRGETDSATRAAASAYDQRYDRYEGQGQPAGDRSATEFRRRQRGI
jgi:hypothetical protein